MIFRNKKTENFCQNSAYGTTEKVIRFMVLLMSFLALSSAVAMLKYGGFFSKITPIITISTIILGGLIRTGISDNKKFKLTLLIAILLISSLFFVTVEYFF